MFYKGNTMNILPKRCIAIGIGSEANFNDSVAIGFNVKTTEEKQVKIGNENSCVVISESNQSKVIIAGIDIIQELDYLKKTIRKQQKIIDILWYAPGMPGYEEAYNNFKIDLERFDKTN